MQLLVIWAEIVAPLKEQSQLIKCKVLKGFLQIVCKSKNTPD